MFSCSTTVKLLCIGLILITLGETLLASVVQNESTQLISFSFNGWGRCELLKSLASCSAPFENDSAFIRVAKSFQPSDYSPPFWARNSHFHTITASGDLESILKRDRLLEIPYIRESWDTPEGFGKIDIDFLLSGYEREQQRMNTQLQSKISQTESQSAKKLIDINCGNNDSYNLINLSRTDDAVLGQWALTKKKSGRKLVVLMHGLESSSRHPLTKKFAIAYAKRGFDVAAMNFRGCSGDLGSHPLGYHLGYTSDLKYFLVEIQRRYPGVWDKVYLTGFSLGANVIINFLGKEGDLAMRKYNVMGASVACAPFNPKDSVRALEKTLIGKLLYVQSFLNIMLAKAEAHLKIYGPTTFDSKDLKQIHSFSEFTTKVILPVHGFQSAEEYYEAVDARKYIAKERIRTLKLSTKSCTSSCYDIFLCIAAPIRTIDHIIVQYNLTFRKYLFQVKVPLLIVNARDDPMICPDTLPLPEEVSNAPVKLVYHEKGGHCAFLTNSSVTKKTTEDRWLPTECARFVEHVDAFFSSKYLMSSFGW